MWASRMRPGSAGKRPSAASNARGRTARGSSGDDDDGSGRG
uniref:Uncharacterized protein n=1 Tax=Arundo donax TaxID=35708 RepID=A0A0A9BE18_ARUDO